MSLSREEFLLRKCSCADVKAILELQKTILDGLPDRELLRENSEEMFVQCTKEPNLTLGLFADGKLSALGILVDATGTEEDLGVGLVCHEVGKSANLKLILVREECRGLGIQRTLMLLLEACVISGGYTHLCSTVSGKNVHSLRNAQAVGYEFDHEATKYGGLARGVYVKTIKACENPFAGCEQALEAIAQGRELILNSKTRELKILRKE